MRAVRWSSVAIVLGGTVLALVCLAAALRGRAWALVVGLVCAGVALREVRALQRLGGRRDGTRGRGREVGR